MKRRYLRVIALLLASMLLFTGCKSLSKEDSGENSEGDNEQAVGTRVTWEEQLSNWKSQAPNEIEDFVLAMPSKEYRISADVYIPDELESYEVENVRISRHIFEDVEGVLKACAASCELQIREEVEVREREEIFENGEYIRFATILMGEKDTSIVSINSSQVMISTPFLQKYANWSLLSWRDRMHVGKVHSETMMEASDEILLSEQEIEKIKTDMENVLGVEFLDNYMLETCTLERLEELLEYEKKYYEMYGLELDPDMSWKATEADEGTVLWLQQGYHGISLLFDEPEFSETGASYVVYNYCNIVSSKEGMKGIVTGQLYDIHEAVETVKILSFGEFIEKHMEMRSGMETEVVKIGLYYLPYYSGEGLDFIAKPVWYVQTAEVGEFGYPVRNAAIYDAVTGKEIPWY